MQMLQSLAVYAGIEWKQCWGYHHSHHSLHRNKVYSVLSGKSSLAKNRGIIIQLWDAKYKDFLNINTCWLDKRLMETTDWDREVAATENKRPHKKITFILLITTPMKPLLLRSCQNKLIIIMEGWWPETSQEV